MLLDEDAERRVNEIITAMAGAFSTLLLGYEGSGAGFGVRPRAGLTYLEQAYLAGKIAKEIGTDALTSMSTAQIQNWINENPITLTNADRATLRSLKRNTDRWLQGRASNWSDKFRQSIALAGNEWRAYITQGEGESHRAKRLARNQALQELLSDLRGQNKTIQADVFRLLQTEMHSYFQEGQTSEVDGEELVYKIPRASACPHCLRLHTKPDGSPKTYRLKDVRGNSNWGKRAWQWKFTIGPVHPHCYCRLYRVSDKPLSQTGNAVLATARREALRKSVTADRLVSHCGYDAAGNPTYEDVLEKSASDEQMPAHQLELIKAIREVYGKGS